MNSAGRAGPAEDHDDPANADDQPMSRTTPSVTANLQHVDWARAAADAWLAIDMGKFLDEQACFHILTDPLSSEADKYRARQRLEELDQ